jgi:hypothetical protein
MKKLIAISVVFALAAGAVFAADVSGGVIGTVNFLEGSNAKDANKDSVPMSASADMQRVRLEGSGENDDGTFGGWARVEANPGYPSSGGEMFTAFGLAWWKPIDMLKLTLGGNPDGFYGKEGVTGWMFYQTASDTGVVNPNTVWYSPGGYYNNGLQTRDAFYGGFGDYALHLTISPADIVDINIAVPFWNGGGEAQYIYKKTVAQLDFKLDFGNIALTYVGAGNTLGYTIPGVNAVYFNPADPTTYPEDDDDFDKDDPDTYPSNDASYSADAPTIFAYFGLTAIENLSIDVGIGFPLPVKNDDVEKLTVTRSNPLAVGLGAKFTAGDFGVKARVVASFAGSLKAEGDLAKYTDEDGNDKDIEPLKDPLKLIFDILPFYNVSDTLRIFFSAGLGITGAAEENKGWQLVGLGNKADAVTGWHINPYVEVGSEWGPKFLAGIQIWSAGGKGTAGDGDKALVQWAVPLALHVGF